MSDARRRQSSHRLCRCAHAAAAIGAAIVTAALLVGLGGCNLVSRTAVVEVELPRQPEHLPGSFVPLEYRVVWRGEGGEERRLFIDGSSSRVSVEIPKHPGLSVLVYARYRDGEFVSRPAAAVFPYDLNHAGRLRTGYRRGFAGVVLHQVLFAIPSFNSRRFVQEVDERSRGNAWLFDRERVVDRLLAGRFSTIYLRPRERFPVHLEVPAGRYVGDNLTAGTYDTQPDGSEHPAEGTSATATAVSPATAAADGRAADGRAADGRAADLRTADDQTVEGEASEKNFEVLSLMLAPGYHSFTRVGPGASQKTTFAVVVDAEGGYEAFLR